MSEGLRGCTISFVMENDYLTSGDLALWENRRGFYGNGGDCGCHQRCGGKSTTAIGLAAGLGGGALLLAVAAAWGVNQASKARQEGNKNTLDALTQNVNNLTSFAFNERLSRETWQNHHMPTIGQFVDVRTGAQANAFSSAFANAESQIVADALTGRSQICPQAVSIYSAPKPCDCVAPQPCGCGCN